MLYFLLLFLLIPLETVSFTAQENQMFPLGFCQLLLILLQKSSSIVPLQVVAMKIKMMPIRTVLGCSISSTGLLAE